MNDQLKRIYEQIQLKKKEEIQRVLDINNQILLEKEYIEKQKYYNKMNELYDYKIGRSVGGSSKQSSYVDDYIDDYFS